MASLWILVSAQSLPAYSVLSHEAIIDSVWDTSIKPLLLKRFPDSNAEELDLAHAYAYGGGIIQDLGYYPFGSRFYSDLTHYLRSGDFILKLIQNSRDLNEYAFALGALEHAAADENGHRMAINISVPILYPKLRAKFGNVVTYEDDPVAHTRTEFGFDVVQAAKNRYAPDAYKKFIGFEVAKPLLQRAFQDTYGMRIEDVFFNVDLAIGTYRRAVSTVLPALTKAAWHTRSKEILRDSPGITRKKFLYNLSRASYENNWGTTYQRPGFGSRVLGFFLRILPKIGPLKALSFKPVTPEMEKFYMASFNASLDRYRGLLAEEAGGRLKLPNQNFDVGKPTKAGDYRLADEAYAKLLRKLEGHYADIPDDLRTKILDFYRDLSLPIATKANKKDWAKLQEELSDLGSSNRPAETRSGGPAASTESPGK